ncbi:PrgI family protein [Candidatus Daviesbacteria bacterium]|nr:PrgI family protein [Candidatus Daviesbacteria bacterium]
MRTTVIPAQITTVEDKIAGNLNLTQILILMVPIFWSAIVYVLVLPSMKLTWYKLPLVLIVLFVCLILSMRIKGKVVLSWLMVILRFNLRPKYFLFNKNDSFLRTMDLPVFEKKQLKLFTKSPVKKEVKRINPNFAVTDLIQLEKLITDPKYTLSFKSNRKGGLYVDFQQIQK